ncbi:ribbon-helix-helix protein, CopG family [Sphingomonas sp. AP4-R1]|uniref:type II toxin-antitoxin system RelB family antitoxin n=1 Tax=Sphingomonas sp. AP4-R1 TaxID=2735134 RepID=UPI0014939FCE|nr:ribbon-helix-helix protein, CopG family [Sphingomonas sp. AP4-R1]QJU58826.1 ribbon-helix-helix protein, CopG family [Sphingomonas sp. AP4-R1]
MLGVRLDSELEQRLAAVARSQGRSKSDIAREAVRRYVDLHDEAFRAEAKRQSLRAGAREAAGAGEGPLFWQASDAEAGAWK